MSFREFLFEAMNQSFGPGDVRRVSDELVRHWTAGSKYLGARETNNIESETKKLTWVRIHARMIAAQRFERLISSKPIIGNYLNEKIRTEAPYAAKLRTAFFGIIEHAPIIMYSDDGNIHTTIPIGFYDDDDQHYMAGMVIHELRHAQDDAFGQLNMNYQKGNIVEYLHQRQEARAHTEQISYFLDKFGVDKALELIDRQIRGVRIVFEMTEFQKVCLRTFVQEMGNHLQRAKTIPLPELHKISEPTETEVKEYLSALSKIWELYDGKKVMTSF